MARSESESSSTICAVLQAAIVIARSTNSRPTVVLVRSATVKPSHSASVADTTSATISSSCPGVIPSDPLCAPPSPRPREPYTTGRRAMRRRARCQDGALMRGLVFAAAVAALAGSCSLLPGQPPSGSHAVVADVRNAGKVPVELGVMTKAGVIPGTAQPASLEALAQRRVTFFVPPGIDWWITANGMQMFSASDLGNCPGTLSIEVNADGSGGTGCGS